MNKKGNVIVVTLFITLVIGLIGLIITKYLSNLIKISSENHKYYKAYYVAYAGIELELGKIKNHGMGFSDRVNKDSQTVSRNITGFNYYFSSHIYSTGKNVTSNPKSLFIDNINCSDIKNYISLGTGEAIMLPLIYDKNNGEGAFSGKNYTELKLNDVNDFKINYSGDIIVSFQSTDNKISKRLDISHTKITTNLGNIFSSSNPFLNLDASKNPFLVIVSNSLSNLCIVNDTSIVAPYSYIQSDGTFIDRSVQLNVIKHHKWANFSVYGIY